MTRLTQFSHGAGCGRKISPSLTALGELSGVTAMTDVTGFGLLGHLLELCQGSELRAHIQLSAIPLLADAIVDCIDAGCVMGGSQRNWQSITQHVNEISARNQSLLCDPQTSGGPLIAVNSDPVGEVTALLKEADCYCQPIGRLSDYVAGESAIEVID